MKRLLCWIIGHKYERYEIYPNTGITGRKCSCCGYDVTYGLLEGLDA
jgi:hypothetical protein